MNIPDYNGAGVYKIDFGFACYIGSSIDVKKRLMQHKYAAKAGREPKRLQVAFEIGGEPSIDIIEKVGDNETVAHLLEREAHWIKEQKPKLNNKSVPGGDVDRDIRWRMGHIKQLESKIEEMQKQIKEDNKVIQDQERWYLQTIGERRKG